MKIYAGVWASLSQTIENDLYFIHAVDVSRSVKFSTQLNGGFGSASFSVPGTEDQLLRWVHAYMNAHVVLFSEFGRRLYEGFVASPVVQDGSLNVDCAGYYAKSAHVTFENIYGGPETEITVSEIIQDCVGLVPEWRDKTMFLNGATTIFRAKDIDMEHRKVRDIIEAALRFGYKETDARSLYFGLWQGRTPYLIPEPKAGSEIYVDWFVPARSAKNNNRLSGFGYSMDDVYNKVYAVYDDEADGVSWTLPAEDKTSQFRFGVIEGVLENGSTPEGLALAETLRNAALDKYRFPRQTVPLTVGPLVQDSSYNFVPAYGIRAGHTVRISDIDPLLGMSGFVGGYRGHSTHGFVMNTEYDGGSGTTRLDIGTVDTSLDVLLGRIGATGGLS